MPDDIANAVNEGVGILNHNTAGGRVRFRTNSAYVAIKAVMPFISVMPHMTLTRSTGFDLYIDQNGKSTYCKTFMPSLDIKDGYESVINFSDNQERDLTINFPLYSDVSNLFIGLQQDAIITTGDDYRYPHPIVYYGSSITQGGCASRPVTCYTAIIFRHLNCDHINLGFAGNAKGEDRMTDYIAGLTM